MNHSSLKFNEAIKFLSKIFVSILVSKMYGKQSGEMA